MNLIVDKIVLDFLSENVYFLHEKEKNEGILFDPGVGADEINKFLSDNNFIVKHILITHAHFDHIHSADYIRKKFNADIYVSDVDKELIEDKTKNESQNFRHPIEIKNCKTFSDGEILELLSIKIECILTPGHTKGGTSYYIEDGKLLFSGDTLFKNSYGSPKFYSGNLRNVYHSVKDKLFKLPDDVIVYPGHNDSTSIGYEKKFNPINGLDGQKLDTNL